MRRSARTPRPRAYLGTAVGADYRFSPYTIAGFALAGGGTNFSVAGSGSGHSDLFQAGAFVKHTVGAAYISAALAYGWQDITTNRTVTVAGSRSVAARSSTPMPIRAASKAAIVLSTPWMGRDTPYAAAQFTTFDLPAYAEQAHRLARNTFALAYNAKDVTDTRSELGLRTDKSFAMHGCDPDLARPLSPGRMISTPTATSRPPSRRCRVQASSSTARRRRANSALTTASAEVKWINGWSAAATFEGEFSDVTRSYAGKGVVRYVW